MATTTDEVTVPNVKAKAKAKRVSKKDAAAAASVPDPVPVEVPVKKSRAKASKEKEKGKANANAIAADTTQPALFIEELDAQPLPSPPTKKGRKPPIVASVTPEGIHGSLQNNDQRPLIAHLPIHGTDIDSELFCDTSKPKEEKSGMPNPYDPEDVFSMFEQSQLQAPVFESPIPTEETTKHYKQTYHNVGRPSLPIHYSEKLMIRYQDSNREQRLPETSDIACFWDCHPFRTQPCIIPTSIEEGIWRVYGNFCSPECAAAFLFHERLDSHADRKSVV